jgi:hypothetical protein
MSDPQTTASAASGRNKILGFLLPAYLIAIFLWRVLTPAHELPLRTEQMLEIGLDALVLIGLIGLRKQIAPALFWIALIAGLGLFAIRATGDTAWWSGHLMWSLPPR